MIQSVHILIGHGMTRLHTLKEIATSFSVVGIAQTVLF